MALAKKTISLLKRIQKKVIEEPLRLNMCGWGYIHSKRSKSAATPPCRTTACIAGWTVFLDRPQFWKDLLKNDDTSILSYKLSQETTPGLEAGKILDLSPHQQAILFFDHNWPSKFYLKYLEAKTPTGRARATVNRIEHFIKTDGAE